MRIATVLGRRSLRRRWEWAMAACGALLVLAHLGLSPPPRLPDPTPEQLHAALPAANEVSDDGHGRWRATGEGETLVGAVGLSSTVAPMVVGYNGQLHLLVGVDRGGAIRGVELLAHEETPAYLELVESEGFLERFAGQPAGAPEVDVVSGATVTSEAIAEDVRTTSRALAEGSLGLTLAPPPARQAQAASLSDVLRTGLLLVVLLVAGLGALWPRVRVLRSVGFGLSLVVVGLLLNVPLALGGLSRLLRLQNPFPGAGLPALLVLAFALGAAALLGRNLYCERVCPFHALQRIAQRLGPRLRLPSRVALRAAAWLRPLLVVVALGLLLWLDDPRVRSWEPWVGLFDEAAPPISLAFAAAAVLAAAWVPGLWCEALCPTGALLDGVAALHRTVLVRRAPRSASPGLEPPSPRSAPQHEALATAGLRSRGASDTLFALALLALVVLGLAQAAGMSPEPRAPEATALPRFDREVILDELRRGRLSRHPARFGEALGAEQAPPAPDAPGAADDPSPALPPLPAPLPHRARGARRLPEPDQSRR